MITKRILLKAIRKNCLDCSGGVASEVVDCSMKRCPLYPYRMGVAGLYSIKEGKKWLIKDTTVVEHLNIK